MFLTIQKAAEQAGLTPGTLRRYEHDGLISPARTSAGHRIYSAVEIAIAKRIAAERRACWGYARRGVRAEAGAA